VPTKKNTSSLCVKAYQISEEFVASFRSKSNSFVAPSSILVQLPLKVRNPGLITAFLYDVYDSCQLKICPILGHKTENAFPIEHDLEHCCQWVDDLVEEQNKFQSYLRSIEPYKDHLRWHAKRRGENDKDDLQTPLWKSTAEPPRLDSLLIANQIREYCTGINSHATYILSMLQIETILWMYSSNRLLPRGHKCTAEAMSPTGRGAGFPATGF